MYKEYRLGSLILAAQIFIAIGTLVLQWSLQQRLDDREYVHMAINILSQPKNEHESYELRKWAVDVLNEKSPVPFGFPLSNLLWSGEFILPTSTISIESSEINWSELLLKNR